MFAKTLVPALAVLSAVSAQTQNTICSSDATINSQADANQYSSCTSIDGDVNLGSGATGAIYINGPTSITGTLTAKNATTLNELGSTTIESIGKGFDLLTLQALGTLRFDELTEVGSINWDTLPALGALTFPAIISSAKTVIIQNTFLRSLDGINLGSVDTINVSNNRRLTKFDTQVTSVGTLINIADNNADLEVSLPNLQTAKDITFRNMSSVSIPSLRTVNGSLGFYGTFMDSLSAPNLTTVGNFNTGQGSLSFVNNNELMNITLPALTSIGGAAYIAQNDKLEGISFPELTQIGGAIDFAGVFTTPDLTSLTDVKGAFNMQSKSTIDCGKFQKLKGVVQGKFTCVTTSDAKSADGTSTGGTGTTTGAAASGSATPKNAAPAFGASEAVVGLSALGALFSLFL